MSDTSWKEREDVHVAAMVAMTEAGKSVAASLAAAISLLERGGKKAAASDKMFDVMLDDYRQSLNDFRDTYARVFPAMEQLS